MFRITYSSIFLAVLVTPLLGGCELYYERYAEERAIQHFEKNEPAFISLGEALKRRPEVETAIYYRNEADRIDLVQPERREGAPPPAYNQDEANIYFEPYLKDLNFPGSPIWFARLHNGSYRIPNMGAKRGTPYYLDYTLIFDPDRVISLPKCEEFEPNGDDYDCIFPLKKSWALKESGINMVRVKKETEEKMKCWDEGRDDCEDF